MTMLHHFDELIKHDDPDNFGSEIDYEESDYEDNSQLGEGEEEEQQNPIQ